MQFFGTHTFPWSRLSVKSLTYKSLILRLFQAFQTAGHHEYSDQPVWEMTTAPGHELSIQTSLIYTRQQKHATHNRNPITVLPEHWTFSTLTSNVIQHEDWTLFTPAQLTYSKSFWSDKSHHHHSVSGITTDQQTTHYQLFMVALCNRADHYIFILFLLLSYFSRLISAVGDWRFTILWHMVWP